MDFRLGPGEEIQNVYNNAPREFLLCFLKTFKVNTTTDIAFHFTATWDPLAAYRHFIFQFIKKDVLLTRPLGLFIQPRSPMGNQMQELMNTAVERRERGEASARFEDTPQPPCWLLCIPCEYSQMGT